MTTYSQDLFFKELPCSPIDEQLLLNCEIPGFSQEDRYQHENTPAPHRRDMVITSDGIVKTSHHRSRIIKDLTFKNHIIELLKNETTDFENILIRKQWIWGSTTSSPHTDHGRDTFYMYIVDLGGDNVLTNWYEEPGYPLIQKWERRLTKLDDTRHLKKIHTAIFKPKTWYKFNANIIHDVVNITSVRSAIAVETEIWKE